MRPGKWVGSLIIDSLGYQTVELELNPKNNGAFTGDWKDTDKVTFTFKKIFIVVKYT